MQLPRNFGSKPYASGHVEVLRFGMVGLGDSFTSGFGSGLESFCGALGLKSPSRTWSLLNLAARW